MCQVSLAILVSFGQLCFINHSHTNFQKSRNRLNDRKRSENIDCKTQSSIELACSSVNFSSREFQMNLQITTSCLQQNKRITHLQRPRKACVYARSSTIAVLFWSFNYTKTSQSPKRKKARSKCDS